MLPEKNKLFNDNSDEELKNDKEDILSKFQSFKKMN